MALKILRFNSIDEINSAYRDIWNKYRKREGLENVMKYFNRWPIQYDPRTKHEDLLFVGFNPSFDEKDTSLMIKDEIELNDQNKIMSVIAKEIKATRGDENNKRYDYYLKFPEISTALGYEIECWNHIDFLPFRNRNQKELISAFSLNRTINEWSDKGSLLNQLLEEILNIFIVLIEFIHPKIIVIVNGFLSGKIIDLTGSQFLNQKGEDSSSINEITQFKISTGSLEEKGYRTLKIVNEYPILLSSMLTQGGALDRGSRERLVWHIKQILDAKK